MRFRRLFKIAGVAFAVVAAWALYEAFATPPPGPMGEVINPEEEVLTSQILANGVSIVNSTQTGGIYHRDGHPKTQGCARATFTVRPLSWPYSQGVFAQPRSYKAWVRFSSGNPEIQSDWKPDARGMAVKVLGVGGQKLLEGEENARTQDFLMMSNPAFFIANVQEYAKLTRLQALGYQSNNGMTQFRYFLEDDAGRLWNPSGWRLREFRLALGILKWPPKNLLATQYYSITASTLGVQNYVKYSARPVACDARSGIPGSGVWSFFDSDVLRHSLARQLASARKYCFDFMIQPQVQQKNMPVEDATVAWAESDSPFIPAARIELSAEDIGQWEQSGFCENLSFSPWHALPEHRPVGGLNRIRKAVYQGISQYRHCKNGVAMGEPKEDGSPAFETARCSANQPVPGSARSPS